MEKIRQQISIIFAGNHAYNDRNVSAKEVGNVLLWKENMRLAEHEETSSDVRDLDDFIFSGEEWHISER